MYSLIVLRHSASASNRREKYILLRIGEYSLDVSFIAHVFVLFVIIPYLFLKHFMFFQWMIWKQKAYISTLESFVNTDFFSTGAISCWKFLSDRKIELIMANSSNTGQPFLPRRIYIYHEVSLYRRLSSLSNRV